MIPGYLIRKLSRYAMSPFRYLVNLFFFYFLTQYFNSFEFSSLQNIMIFILILFLFMASAIEIGFQTGLGHHRWLFGVHKGRSNEQIRCARQPGAKPQMCHDKRFL